MDAGLLELLARYELTDDGFAILLAVRPEMPLSAPLDAIYAIQPHLDAPMIKVTTRSYMPLLRVDPSNPYDEMDFYIYFGPNTQLRDALLKAMQHRSGDS